MTVRLSFKPIGSALLITAGWLWGSTYAQDQASQRNNASANTADEYPNSVELDLFGKLSLWGQNLREFDEKLRDGAAVDERVTYDMSQRFGLELSYLFNTDNGAFLLPKDDGIVPHGLQNAKQYTGEIESCEPPATVRLHRAGRRQYQLSRSTQERLLYDRASVAFLTEWRHWVRLQWQWRT